MYDLPMAPTTVGGKLNFERIVQISCLYQPISQATGIKTEIERLTKGDSEGALSSTQWRIYEPVHPTPH